LWAAMISLSRQIGLLGAFHGVIGTGLGDQLNQILASSWAMAGPHTAVETSAAIASAILRDFINIPPQTYVLFEERMSQFYR